MRGVNPRLNKPLLETSFNSCLFLFLLRTDGLSSGAHPLLDRLHVRTFLPAHPVRHQVESTPTQKTSMKWQCINRAGVVACRLARLSKEFDSYYLFALLPDILASSLGNHLLVLKTLHNIKIGLN